MTCIRCTETANTLINKYTFVGPNLVTTIHTFICKRSRNKLKKLLNHLTKLSLHINRLIELINKHTQIQKARRYKYNTP